jgi:hypothetical protein
MKRLFGLLVLLACMVAIPIFFNGCAKEYSYEGGVLIRDSTDTVVGPVTTPVADFTLSGNPNCTDPGIRGTYEAAVNMNSSNYIDAMVDVNSTGTYKISTDTVDGMYFIASGTFTKTGSQRVSVLAYGTPAFPGNLVFHLDAGKSACTFALTVVLHGYPATYVLESNYDSSCASHTVIGDYYSGVSLTAANKINIRTYVTIPGVYALETNTVNGVSFRYAGEFTSTGVVYLDLLGSGTPIAKGSFTYKLRIVGPSPKGGASCGIAVDYK